MASAVLLLLVCIALVFASVAGHEEETARLIAFNESHKVWMSQAAIEGLMVQRINFMDVTEQPEIPTPLSPPSTQVFPTQPRYKQYVDSLLPLISQNQLSDTVTQLSEFHNRYYTQPTGVSGATWIFDAFTKYSAGRTDISVQRWAHSWAQPSIIARIPGIGLLSDEIVIIGAHEDSTAGIATARAPGADDDASGTATVLEAFRVLVASGFRPDRTLEFHTYAAEEAGLLGSQNIANTYLSRNTSVYAQLQLDMTGYGSGPFGIITDFTNANLTAFLRILIDTYTLAEWRDSSCGYACSDHASWFRAGYASTFPVEAPFGSGSPYIHTANDLPSTVNFNKVVEFAKLAVSFAVELAEVGVAL